MIEVYFYSKKTRKGKTVNAIVYVIGEKAVIDPWFPIDGTLHNAQQSQFDDLIGIKTLKELISSFEKVIFEWKREEIEVIDLQPSDYKYLTKIKEVR